MARPPKSTAPYNKIQVFTDKVPGNDTHFPLIVLGSASGRQLAGRSESAYLWSDKTSSTQLCNG